MELLGVYLQVDPYFVELEGEDDGLFGDAGIAVASTEVAAAESDVEPDAAEDTEAETAEYRFLPSPTRPFNPKRKTTVPPGTSRFEAGAANAFAREAVANSTDGGATNETSAYCRYITSILMKQASPSPVVRWTPERRRP